MADDSYPGGRLLVGVAKVDETKTPTRKTGGVFFMGIITRNLSSTYFEEIRDPARQSNLQSLQTLTCDGLSHFHPRAIDSLCNLTSRKTSCQAEKCQVPSLSLCGAGKSSSFFFRFAPANWAVLRQGVSGKAALMRALLFCSSRE